MTHGGPRPDPVVWFIMMTVCLFCTFAGAAAWRENLEARRDEVMHVLRGYYGDGAGIWYHRWRLFFLACEELFGYDRGREWGVGQYRLRRSAVPALVPA